MIDFLTKEEQHLLYDVPATIAILVAGADGKIKHSEIERAIEVTHWKKYHARPDLMSYYKVVEDHFEDKIAKKIDELPEAHEQRNAILIGELEKLNKILPKLDKIYAAELYASWRELAKSVAEGAGGFLGYLKVDFNESKLISLPMIRDPRL